IKLRRQAHQFQGNSIEFRRRCSGNLAISAHVSRLQFLSSNPNECQRGMHTSANRNEGFGTLDALTIQYAAQLNSHADDVVFDSPPLRRRPVRQILRKSPLGVGDSERVFHISQQFVDVPARNRQATSVVRVERLLWHKAPRTQKNHTSCSTCAQLLRNLLESEAGREPANQAPTKRIPSSS